MKFNRRLYTFGVLLSLLLVFTSAIDFELCTVSAETGPPVPVGIFRGAGTAVRSDVSPPLRHIPASMVVKKVEPQILESFDQGPNTHQTPGRVIDPVVQTEPGLQSIPALTLNFNGPTNLANVSPPSPSGEAGPNHYVVMSNLYFAIYSKTGSLLFGPAPNNTLWAGFGGNCETENAGDPIVLYDQLADRWILTQFTVNGPTYFNCVAISTSPDPAGSYYRYAFSTGTNFPDIPKFAVWPDAYYISNREFNGSNFAGVGAYAVNRAQMLDGNPSPQVISFLITPASAGGAYNIGDGLLPADLEGATLPPDGSPAYFMGSMDDGGPYGAPQDALTLWRFSVNFSIPANSTFTLAATLPVAAFDSIFPCSPTSRACIPQPGTTNKLDFLSYRQRLMPRLSYRNFGTHESLVANQSVEAVPSLAGIRWYEVRNPRSSPIVYQQGTYAPGALDGVHRWIGSLAVDASGNMALGYSVSDGISTYPGIRYTGRLAADPSGTMPQGEGVIVTGTGSQTGSQRWGDYTAMSVDPVDDCTFWYVNEYLPLTSSIGWQLRIGAFKFPSCHIPFSVYLPLVLR